MTSREDLLLEGESLTLEDLRALGTVHSVMVMNRAARRTSPGPMRAAQKAQGARRTLRVAWTKRAYLAAGRDRMNADFLRRAGEYAAHGPHGLSDTRFAETLAFLVAGRTLSALPTELAPAIEHQLDVLTDATEMPCRAWGALAALPDTAEPLPSLLDVEHAVTAPRGPNAQGMTRTQSTGRVVSLAAY